MYWIGMGHLRLYFQTQKVQKVSKMQFSILQGPLCFFDGVTYPISNIFFILLVLGSQATAIVNIG